MNSQVKNMTYCALFACMIAIMAQIKIALPGLVPLTLQTLGVYIVGCVLKPKEALLSTIVYIILGAIGLPVFSGFGGGLGFLLGPTGGYIFSFPIVALVISVIVHQKENIYSKTIALCIGTTICYSIGTIWFMYITNNSLLTALSWCVLPFLIGDTIKIVLTIVVCNKIAKYIR